MGSEFESESGRKPINGGNSPEFGEIVILVKEFDRFEEEGSEFEGRERERAGKLSLNCIEVANLGMFWSHSKGLY